MAKRPARMDWSFLLIKATRIICNKPSLRLRMHGGSCLYL